MSFKSIHNSLESDVKLAVAPGIEMIQILEVASVRKVFPKRVMVQVVRVVEVENIKSWITTMV